MRPGTSITQPAHTHSSAPVRSGELSGFRMLAMHAYSTWAWTWVIGPSRIRIYQSSLLTRAISSIAKSTVFSYFPRGQLNNWAFRISGHPVTHVHPRARYWPYHTHPSTSLSTHLQIYRFVPRARSLGAGKRTFHHGVKIGTVSWAEAEHSSSWWEGGFFDWSSIPYYTRPEKEWKSKNKMKCPASITKTPEWRFLFSVFLDRWMIG